MQKGDLEPIVFCDEQDGKVGPFDELVGAFLRGKFIREGVFELAHYKVVCVVRGKARIVVMGAEEVLPLGDDVPRHDVYLYFSRR